MFAPFTSRSRCLGLLFAGLLVAAAPLAQEAHAQRPFRTYDPFYQGETARRTFFDGYAFTAEIYTRKMGLLQRKSISTSDDASQSSTPEVDPIGVSFRIDHQLFPRFNVGAIFDASGNDAGRRITLSWLTMKYFRHLETTKYAFRLAVDPDPDGRVGFPQIDGAFLYTSTLSRRVSSDFALGMRRVRKGYYEQRVVAADELQGYTAPADSEKVLLSIYRRALGWELHAMMSYRYRLDPGGSNLFVSLFGNLASYELVETGRENVSLHQPTSDASSETAAMQRATPSPEPISPFTTEHQSGIVWIQMGLTYSRPSYQAVPFLALPLQQWVPEAENWRRATPHVGLRFMLR